MGIKIIKVHSIGENGINNSFGLKSLTELSIGHPLGIDPYYEYQNSPSDANVKGGTITYKIIGNSFKSYGHEFSIEETPNNLFQNYYDDLFITASIASGDSQKINTLYTARRGETRFTTNSVTDVHNSFALGYGQQASQRFSSHVSGNESGWYFSSQGRFDIKKIPNVFFKYTLDLWFTGRNEPDNPITESIYTSIGTTSANYNYYQRLGSGNSFNIFRGLGGLPIQKCIVSASNTQYQNVQLEFIVTQSYSRIYDAPTGPSYGNRLYYSKSSVNSKNSNAPTLADYPYWWVFINGSWDFGDEYSSKILNNTNPYRSTIKIEPITIIDPRNSVYTQDPPTIGAQEQLSGSFVQPPSSRFQTPNFRGNYNSTIQYRGGDVYQLSTNKLIVLYDNLGYLPSASPPSNLYEQVVTGKVSTFEHTGSAGVWDFGYLGWRYESLRQTSSIVPINNNKDNFNVSDYNPLINSVDGLRPSSVYYDLDYSKGTIEPLNRNQIINESATKAVVVDSNYSSNSWINSRYKGSRVTSPNVNQV